MTTSPSSRWWHLDVPLSYPAPPAGTPLTVVLATPQPIAPPAGELVVGYALGRPVFVAQIETLAVPAALAMTVLPSSDPMEARIHLSAVCCRVLDTDPCQFPPQAPTRSPTGAGLLGAATPAPSPVSPDAEQAPSTNTPSRRRKKQGA